MSKEKCCVSLSSIARFCGGNILGLKTDVKIICINDVVCLPECAPDTHTIEQNIAATSCYNWKIEKKENSYVANPVGDVGFESYESSISFVIAKINPLATYILNATANGQFLVILKDGNGCKRLLGDLDCGATIEVTEQNDDKNAYLITIKYESACLPCFISDDSDITIAPSPALILESNDEVTEVNISADASTYEGVSIANNTDFCGELIFNVQGSTGVVVTETISFEFGQTVDAAISAQLALVGLTSTSLIGQPISNLSNLTLDLAALGGDSLEVCLRVEKCGEPLCEDDSDIICDSFIPSCCCEGGLTFPSGTIGFSDIALTF